ncbi:hypothetical protein DUNSADRAFT_1022 [Dunaliella salina]|uniref:ABC transporter domain-containing protein n=1 Tax=Dunaliella salina TaxID=3046 RepID=A0ABQ7GXL7_DUNSA|nr:hypothetical protein DUNSADRAFT_1022 [Dunaliella salina]|eukprot:KAF5839339.1 hypothetical protein DUNSADRAFT_1022 [Dunaliella salina]
MALYLDSIVPQEPGGTALPWYFLMMPSFWSSNKGYDPSHAKHALDRAEKEVQRKQSILGASAAAAAAAAAATDVPALPTLDATTCNRQLKEAQAGLLRDLHPACIEHADGGNEENGARDWEGNIWASSSAVDGAEREVDDTQASHLPPKACVGILEDDPDVAAEAANAQAICARFLAAHLHPSTSHQDDAPGWASFFPASDTPVLQHKASNTIEDGTALPAAAAHVRDPPPGNTSCTHSSSTSSTVECLHRPGAPSAPALLVAAGQGLPLVGYGGVAPRGPGSMDSTRTMTGSSTQEKCEGEGAGPNTDAAPHTTSAVPVGALMDGRNGDGSAQGAAEGLSFARVGGEKQGLGSADAQQPEQISAGGASVNVSSVSTSHEAEDQGGHTNSHSLSKMAAATAAVSTAAPHLKGHTSRSASSSQSSSNHSDVHQAARSGQTGAQPITPVAPPQQQASDQPSQAPGADHLPSFPPAAPALSHSSTGHPTSSHTSASSSTQASPGAASPAPYQQQHHTQYQQQSEAGTSVSSSTASMANSGGPVYARTGSSSAGSLHVHVGADTHAGTGAARTITDSTGGLSVGRDGRTDTGLAAPLATGLDHRQLAHEQQAGLKQAHRDGAGVLDEIAQDCMGAEGEGQFERKKEDSSHPSQLLPPGVHLFGLQKMFLRSQWWMPQFWLAKHGSKDGGAEGDGTNAPKASMLSWLACMCWPPSTWQWLKQWWADLKKANSLVAVNGVWLSLSPGNCFCLLGPNGAGKTTIIKCLTGAAQASGGDALVWGHSVRGPSGLSAARALTGVCPQFDVLWPQLTGIEHLNLFSHIKGLSSEVAMAEESASLLKQVGLTKAGGVRSGAYSGGMRRRLSLAIALLGDPALLVLDEPTTGLDPVSRRGVWNLLSDAKHGRVMLLTTHSMEEADVLGDRIGIIAAGMLRCLGSGLRLKTRFGDGIRVSVALATKPGEGAAGMDARREVVRRAVQQQLEHPNLFLGHPKLAPQPTESKQLCNLNGQLNGQAGGAGSTVCREEEGFEDARSSFQAGSSVRSSGSMQEEPYRRCSNEGGFGNGREQGSGSEEPEHKDVLGGSTYEHFLVPKEREDVLPELFLCLEVELFTLSIP